MADILVYFDTVNGITDAVTNVIWSDSSELTTSNPAYTLVTVDNINAEDNEIEISSVYYDILHTKSDGVSGLIYDVNLYDYYTTLSEGEEGIDIVPSPLSMELIDDDFTGLTELQASTLIYNNLATRSDLTTETYPDWSNMRDAIAPNDDESYLEVFKYDNGVAHFTAKTFENVTYTATYDEANVGNEWSGWRINGGSISHLTSIPKGSSQTFSEIINSNQVIITTTNAGAYMTTTIPRANSGISIGDSAINKDTSITVNFATGQVTLDILNTSNGTTISHVTIL